MGFVERILGEIRHLIIYFVCRLLADPIGDTARHMFFFITIHKVLTLLRHHRCFFLGHSAAHQVTAPQSISPQIPHDLHDLLLIYDTPVSGFQDRLKLRAVISDGIRIVLPPNVLGNEIHGTGTIQGDTGDHILQRLGLQLFHETLHPRALQLEHPIRLARSQRRQYCLIVIVNLIHI